MKSSIRRLPIFAVIIITLSLIIAPNNHDRTFAQSDGENLMIFLPFVNQNADYAGVNANLQSAAVPTASGNNLALNKPAIQSTTGAGGVASRAVDGNTSGVWKNGSTTHTKGKGSANPWWRVDLGATYDVNLINVFNRTDNCCSSRLNGATVYVGNVDSTNPADYTAVGTLTGSTSVQTFTAANTSGRYVMVRIEGQGILSLAEVQVFGEDQTTGVFVPDPNKIYHIDNPAHGLRLAATGDSEILQSAPLTSSGVNTQWRFVQSATNGLWHIQRAAGGSTPRIRTVLSTKPDMQATRSSGDWTRFSITANPNRPGTYLLTVPLANTTNQRLRLLGNGTTDFSTNNNTGNNPSFVFTEVNSAEASSSPNIVVIYADDLGYEDISAYGSSVVSTPNLDSIGDDGFTALDYFTASNVCSPSRASVLTGRYPMRNGVPVAVTPGSAKQIAAGFGLHTDEVTIPELLENAGYHSIVIGKWHLGWDHEGSHPMDQGFDTSYGLKENYNANGDRDTLYRKRNVEIQNVDPTALAELYTQRAEEFIEFNAGRDQPFFMFMSHHIVHTPHTPSEDFVNSSQNGAYGDAIQELDHSTGRILQALDDAGIADNTLVIFTSDNGGWRKQNASNGNFSGGKYNTMEGGHIVPAMFKWPDVIPSGLSSDATITSMDLMPLIARAAGVSLPNDRVIDGRDITEVVTGRTSESPHEVLYYYNGTNLQAVRKGNWKLHLPRTANDQPWWQGFSGSTDTFDTLTTPQLFDLSSDPGETQNLFNAFPAIAQDLMAEADAARLELGDVDIIGSDQRVPPMADPQRK